MLISKPKEKRSKYYDSFYRTRPKPRPWRTLFYLLLLISVILSIGKAIAKPMSTQVADFSTIGAGDLQLHSTDKTSSFPAQMLPGQVDIQVHGLIATTTLTQSFINHSQQYLDGTYSFPLPENSAVNYLKIEVGNRVIEGKIVERQQARQLFQQAKFSGKKASLVEQQRPNLFTNNIANLAPNEQITVTLAYVQTVDYKDGVFSLRFPMTITDRYNPGASNENNNEHSNSAPLYLPSSLHGTMDVNVSLVSGFSLASVTSPSHPQPQPAPTFTSEPHFQTLAYSASTLSTSTPMRIHRKQLAMERDFVLQWRPSPSQKPQLSIFQEKINSDYYALVMLMPPVLTKSEQASANDLPRDITLIIDTSGSMQGTSIIQAKQSLLFALEQLEPQDSFNLIAFDSTYRMLFPHSQMASQQRLREAKRFVSNLEADGGTEMRAPLQQALTMPLSPEQDPEVLRQIIFITDGAVSNDSELFKLIELAPSRPRLFTVGIGSAPNGYFMRKAAQFGQGSYTYVSKVDQVQEKMQTLLCKISQPVLRDLSINYHPMHLNGLEQLPRQLPDVYANEPMLFSFKSSTLPDSIELFAEQFNQGWHDEIILPRRSKDTNIATVWARAKIEDLMDQLITGSTLAQIKPQVITTSITHQIVSPYTSFLAVESEPQLTAQASSEKRSRLALPQTAAGWKLSTFIGIGLLVITWLVGVLLCKKS